MWAQTHDLLVVRDAMRHSSTRTSEPYTAFDRESVSKVVRKLTVKPQQGSLLL